MKFLLPFIALTLTLAFSPAIDTENVAARERSYSPHHENRFDQPRPSRERNYETLAPLPTTITTSAPVVTDTTNQPTIVAPAPVTKPTETIVTKPKVTEAVIEPIPEPKPTLVPTLSYLEQIAAEIHRLTNLERTNTGLAPLTIDPVLTNIATAHSEDMLKRDYFSHVTPENCNLTCRFEAADYEAWAWGENIAWRQSSDLPSAEQLATHFFENWMDSRGHRQNILSEDYSHEGIGLAQKNNTVYITVNFAEPQ